jgi:hypothetical protein
MLLACDEASIDNRCLELKRTRVSVSTQVYILQGRTGLYFSSLQKNPLLHMWPTTTQTAILVQTTQFGRESKKTTMKTNETRIC